MSTCDVNPPRYASQFSLCIDNRYHLFIFFKVLCFIVLECCRTSTTEGAIFFPNLDCYLSQNSSTGWAKKTGTIFVRLITSPNTNQFPIFSIRIRRKSVITLLLQNIATPEVYRYTTS